MAIRRRDIRNFICRAALAAACAILFAAVIFNINIVHPVQEALANTVAARASPLREILSATAGNANLDLVIVVALLIVISLFGKRRSPPSKL